MNSDVVIVVPTFNEAGNIEELVTRIAAALPGACVLIVDDNSPDGTADLAESLAFQVGGTVKLSILRRMPPRGLGRAYRDGFERALSSGAQFVMQMDADLSHNPADLPLLKKAVQDGAGLAIGSRYCEGGSLRDWPVHRRALSKFAGIYVRLIAGIRLADPTAGFRCWAAESLRRVNLSSVRSEGYSFQVEMSHRAQRAGTAIVEVPITFTDRVRGTSKISRRVLWESFVLPWRFRIRPWHPTS